MALNERQRLFAEGVVSGLSATEAYKRAGYKSRGHGAESSAAEILRNPEVDKYLTELRKPRVEAVKGSVEWITAMLIENTERAMTAVPVYDAEGEPTGEYTYQGNVANKSLELLGKYRGMFVETRREIKGVEMPNATHFLPDASQQPGD